MYEPTTRLTGADLRRHVERHDCTIGKSPEDQRAEDTQRRDNADRDFAKNIREVLERGYRACRDIAQADLEARIRKCIPGGSATAYNQEVAERHPGNIGIPCC